MFVRKRFKKVLIIFKRIKMFSQFRCICPYFKDHQHQSITTSHSGSLTNCSWKWSHNSQDYYLLQQTNKRDLSLCFHKKTSYFSLVHNQFLKQISFLNQVHILRTAQDLCKAEVHRHNKGNEQVSQISTCQEHLEKIQDNKLPKVLHPRGRSI